MPNVIRVEISESMKQRLQRLAEAEGKDLDFLIREMLNRSLGRVEASEIDNSMADRRNNSTESSKNENSTT